VVLLITKQLRKCGEDTKEHDQTKSFNNTKAASSKPVFVEFFGPSVSQLSIADRSAVANLCTEYGAKVGYFPVDETTLEYLRHTGRDPHQIDVIEMYMKKVNMFRSTSSEKDVADTKIEYDSIINIDLSGAQVTISGPKKTKERIFLQSVAENFTQSLTKMYDVHCDMMGASINIDLGI
jgi:aconitate hydratase